MTDLEAQILAAYNIPPDLIAAMPAHHEATLAREAAERAVGAALVEVTRQAYCAALDQLAAADSEAVKAPPSHEHPRPDVVGPTDTCNPPQEP